MPGFDGTGPLGQGPMTGRGLGYCASYQPAIRPYGTMGYQVPYYWGRRFGGGFGRGCGRGFGRGMGRGRGLGRRFW